MKLFFRIVPLVIIFILIGLYILYQASDNENRIIYRNQFNSKKDISKITGNGELSIKKGALKIIGGCMQPSGAIEIPFDQKSGYYRLSFWVKSNLIGRSDVLMYWMTNTKRKYLSGKEAQDEFKSTYLWGTRANNPIFRIKSGVKNKWVYSESTNYLKKPKDGKLMVELYVGGFIAGGKMEIDNIVLERVSDIRKRKK